MGKEARKRAMEKVSAGPLQPLQSNVDAASY
jgi:hypothetical protein